MKTFLSAVLFLGLLNFSAAPAAQGAALQCIGSQAVVRVATWDRGCTKAPLPFYQELHLHSEGLSGGTIDFTLGYTPWDIAPHCDNPRGTMSTTLLPLPIDQGTWSITADGVLLGEVSFTTILPCKIRPPQ